MASTIRIFIGGMFALLLTLPRPSSADDGRDMKRETVCARAETDAAIKTIESGQGWSDERWAVLQRLFSCYGATFVSEKTLRQTESSATEKEVRYYIPELHFSAVYVYGRLISGQVEAAPQKDGSKTPDTNRPFRKRIL